MINLRPRIARRPLQAIGAAPAAAAAAQAPSDNGSGILWLLGTLAALWGVSKIWNPAKLAYAGVGASEAGSKDWRNKEEFIKYFMSFYGPRGVYPDVLPGLEKHEIVRGIEMRMRGGDFDGDSIDREVIRDFILEARTGQNVESEWRRTERGHGRAGEASERKAAPKTTGSEAKVRDRDGNLWLVIPGTPFLEDDDGERYTRDYVNQKHGPLTPVSALRGAAAERKLGKKQLDSEIERIFNQHGQNIEFNIMDLGKIHSAGRDAYLAGQPIEPAIVAAIAKYRMNEHGGMSAAI